MGGVSPISQSTQSATPVLPSEEALWGDRTGLAWGHLLSKVTPSQTPPLPHPILAHHRRPPPPNMLSTGDRWAQRWRPRHQGLGLTTTSLTFWNPSPSCVLYLPTQQPLHGDPRRTTCVLGRLQCGAPRIAPRFTRHPHPRGVQSPLPSVHVPSRLVPRSGACRGGAERAAKLQGSGHKLVIFQIMERSSPKPIFLLRCLESE